MQNKDLELGSLQKLSNRLDELMVKNEVIKDESDNVDKAEILESSSFGSDLDQEIERIIEKPRMSIKTVKEEKEENEESPRTSNVSKENNEAKQAKIDEEISLSQQEMLKQSFE